MNKEVDATPIIVMLVYFAIIIGALVGYILNIVKLVGLAQGELTTMFVLRLVGLIPPVGAILGWF